MTNSTHTDERNFFPSEFDAPDCVRVRSHQRKQEKEGNEDDEEEHV